MMATRNAGQNRQVAPLGEQTEAVVRQGLEAAGSRYTRQRAEVFAFLQSVETHPTVEEVYRAVRRRVPRISLATVYNALEALVSARLAAQAHQQRRPLALRLPLARTTTICGTSRLARSATWPSASIPICWRSWIRR